MSDAGELLTSVFTAHGETLPPSVKIKNYLYSYLYKPVSSFVFVCIYFKQTLSS